MSTIDFTPLFRNSIGFDSLVSVLNNALESSNASSGYPPYNIEATDENRYSIILAVAGFGQDEIDIQVENDLLTIRGQRSDSSERRNYLYQGIAERNFERKFNLADYVDVVEAKLENGLLAIHLVKTIPEAMKPRHIDIKTIESVQAELQQQDEAQEQHDNSNKAA